jgi:hypothetical protein
MQDEQPLEHDLCLVCRTRPRRDRSRCCGGCFARLRGDLATLRFGYIHLDNEMKALRPAIREGTRHGKSESRPPVRVDLVDVGVAIEENLIGYPEPDDRMGWARGIARWHQPAIAGPAEWSVPVVIRWLLDQALPWISDQQWVWEFADDMAELRRRAYSAAPWQRVRVDLPTPCPGCTFLSLSTYPGDQLAVCRNRGCGRQVPIATMKETRRWTRTIAAA